MRSIAGLWRWRANELRRPSDRNEAWLALCALLLMLLGAPLVGVLAAAGTHDTLLRTVHEQRHSRHQVWATAQSEVTRAPADSDPEGSVPQAQRQVRAQWTGPDGSDHQAGVGVARHVRPGERFRIWTDAQGRATLKPLSEHTASSHAVLAGIAAGAGAAGVVEVARRLVLVRSLRRRYALWEAEWQRIGPDWGRTGKSH
jgi:hypothetical protein